MKRKALSQHRIDRPGHSLEHRASSLCLCPSLSSSSELVQGVVAHVVIIITRLIGLREKVAISNPNAHTVILPSCAFGKKSGKACIRLTQVTQRWQTSSKACASHFLHALNCSKPRPLLINYSTRSTDESSPGAAPNTCATASFVFTSLVCVSRNYNTNHRALKTATPRGARPRFMMPLRPATIRCVSIRAVY